MKRRRLLLSLTALVGASGCNLDTTEEVVQEKPKTDETPQETPKDNEEDDGPISQAFLWKPVSDNFGKLVVLLPAAYASVDRITVSGAKTESSSRSAIGNGGRPHYRFSLPGASYGNNVRVTGGGKTWVVPDGSKRTSL